MLSILEAWYEERTQGKPQRNLISGGLVLAGRLVERFPLTPETYATEGGQVRGVSGTSVRRILRRHGIEKSMGTEVGRTSRGTLPAVEDLARRWNEVACFSDLTQDERGAVVHSLEAWLAARARAYLEARPLRFDIDLQRPVAYTMAAVLDAAAERGGATAGAVAQHLVGAKLALRFPGVPIPNHKSTTSDAATRRRGDFEVGSTVFHVTVQPMPPVFEKLRDVEGVGLRSYLLVREGHVLAARQLASLTGVTTAAIVSLESFLGQNVEEMAGFHHETLSRELLKLFETYNARVAEVETDASLRLEVPDVLARSRKPQEGHGG